MKKIISQSFLLLMIFVFSVFFNSNTVHASGTLSVTSVSSVKLTGVANNTFDDGWRWIFHITLPSDETLVSMRFTDFSNGSQMIPASNIRLFSEQSTDSNNQVTATNIVGAFVYSNKITINPALDLNPSLDGTQIDITVEARIPFGITGSGFNTNYDVASDAPEVTVPDNTPVSEVYATTTQIVSGLCFYLDRPDNGKYRANITSGNIRLGTTTKLYPGTFMTSPSISSLASFGYDWIVYVSAFPNIVNGYAMTTYPEFRDPATLASTTLVGRIKYNTSGEIIFIDSINPDCPEVEISNPPTDTHANATTTNIVSGLCLYLDHRLNMPIRVGVTSGVVGFGTTTRNYPAIYVSSQSAKTIETYGNDWYLALGVFPSLITNSYTLFTYDEAHDPLYVGSSTIVGRIKFDNVGNVTFIESTNPNCPKVEIGNFSKPVITSDAPKEITHYVGSAFSDPVASAWDSIDGDITSKMSYSENIDVWTPGDYFVNINVTNSSGYMADTFTQIIHVVQPITEVIN